MAPTLLTLPLELRELIYAQLFSSYTVRHGFGTTSSNRTSILATCRQIHLEAWHHLPLNITLHFRGTEPLLDTLLNISQSVLTRLRHIRVKAFPFPLYATGHTEYYTTYHFANALTLLPGLNLSRLEIEDSFHGFGLVEGWRDIVTYFDIESLLQSEGWRELVYVTPCTDFITSGYDHKRRRVAQPEGWDQLLKERDGEDSGAEVNMFITPKSQSEGEPAWKDDVRPWKAIPGHLVVENWRLSTPEQEMKGEVRIVAQRGKRAAAVQTGYEEKRSWKELKEQEGGFRRDDWQPYYNDMADAVGWLYGGWGRRMQLANYALNH